MEQEAQLKYNFIAKSQKAIVKAVRRRLGSKYSQEIIYLALIIVAYLSTIPIKSGTDFDTPYTARLIPATLSILFLCYNAILVRVCGGKKLLGETLGFAESKEKKDSASDLDENELWWNKARFIRVVTHATIIFTTSALAYSKIDSASTINSLLLFLVLSFIIFIISLIDVLVLTINGYTSSGKCLAKTRGKSRKYKLKNAEPCRYCGNKQSGLFLCGECGAVLWYHLKEKHKNWLLTTSVFVLRHRWAVIVALSSVLLVGPFYALTDRRKEIQKEEHAMKDANEKTLNAILNDLSLIRAKTQDLEANDSCYYNVNSYRELTELYTSVYWNIAPAFERLLENTLNINPKFKEAFDDVEELNKNYTNKNEKFKKFNEGIESWGLTTYGLAYIIQHKKFDLSGVLAYTKYTDAVYKTQWDTSYIKERKIAAKNLYHRLRVSSIIIRTLIDSKWLLNKDGFDEEYKSEAADDKFYFDAIFPDSLIKMSYNLPENWYDYNPIFTYPETKNLLKKINIYNLIYDYNVRNFEAFDKINSCKKKK